VTEESDGKEFAEKRSCFFGVGVEWNSEQNPLPEVPWCTSVFIVMRRPMMIDAVSQVGKRHSKFQFCLRSIGGE
jgi:hypothetical protein